MKCLTPIIRQVPHYQYKDGSFVVKSVDYYLCGCGKCVPCMLADQRDWAFRLQLEAEVRESAWFITLTYDDAFMPSDRQLVKDAVPAFMNHLRKRLERICKSHRCEVPKLTYFAVGEYGRKGNRPHYHIMLFGFPLHRSFEMLKVVESVWRKGFCKVEFCDSSSCNYVCKYMSKLDPRPHDVVPFRLMSRRPALGYDYFRIHPEVIDYLNRLDTKVLHFKDGKSHRIPRSIRRKFYKFEKSAYTREYAVKSLDWVLAHAYEVAAKCDDGRVKNELLLQRIYKKFM